MLRLSASSARTRRKSPARLIGLLGLPFLLVLAVAMSVSAGGAATAAAACQAIANGPGSGTVTGGTGGGSGAVGQLTPLQVEQYWVGAGGPMSGAVTAAALADAESSDITDRIQGSSPSAPSTPTANTPSDPALVGWGLWQITPGSAADYDPTVNAKIAVEKYQGSLAAGGGGWSPWTTYGTSGYYAAIPAAQAAYAQLTAQGGGGVSPGATGKTTPAALTAKVTTASPTAASPTTAKAAAAKATQIDTSSADSIDTSGLSPIKQAELNNLAATMQSSGESSQCPNVSVSGSLPTVPGQLATIDAATGVAAAPTGLPPAVGTVIDKLIAAGNQIHTYPYIAIHYPSMATMWPGYDCSGSTSYILYKAGLLGSAPYVSGMFDKWGQPGPGKYVTVFYNAAHVFIEVDGIVFDTAHYAPTEPAGTGPRWQPSSMIQAQINGDVADGNGGFAEAHPPGL